MASIAGILGNPVLEQILLYNVLGQVVSAALGPFQTELAQEMASRVPIVALSPQDMADAVIRNVIDEAGGAAEAAQAGVNAARFHTLTLLAGNAPDPTSLAIALRRKLIDAGTYDKGIRQGRLRDEWADTVRELAVQEPSPMDALTALVEGQLDEGTARDKFAAFGGMPSEFDWLYGTVGAGPSPLEAASMAYRGVIPWGGTGLGVVSFDQAIAEGHTRTKWTEAYRKLSEYLPPPRTVTAMHAAGALTDAQASQILEEHGLSKELAAAYMLASHKAKTAGTKNLAQSTVEALYRDRIIDAGAAEGFLGKLGYTAEEAGYIIAVEDMRQAETAMRAAVSRVGSLYVGHKIDAGQASTALASLGVDAKGAGELVGIWGYERVANVKHVSAAQIEAAFGHGIIDQGTAQAMLESEGWAPYDAWLALSVHNKAALPGEPSRPTAAAPSGP